MSSWLSTGVHVSHLKLYFRLSKSTQTMFIINKSDIIFVVLLVAGTNILLLAHMSKESL